MADLRPHEIALLLIMYDRGIIGMPGYTSIERVRSKVKWQQIQAAYGIKNSLESVARHLVKRKLLSDDGKSLAVLYLDRLGTYFVTEYLAVNPRAFSDLEAKLNKK